MFGPGKKLLSTKLAKQVTGYWLIQNDLEFASWAFNEASKLPSLKETPAPVPLTNEEMAQASRDAVETAAREKIAAFGRIRPPEGPHMVRSALFEAGIVSYGRCFNSGARTSLADSLFRNALSHRKELHSWIIRVRNKHVGHSELKLERSLVSIQMVADPRFGPRPSMNMGIFAVRRDAPAAGQLTALAEHCDAIIAHFVQPRQKKLGAEIREQLLRMPTDQIAALPDYDQAMQAITTGLTFENI